MIQTKVDWDANGDNKQDNNENYTFRIFMQSIMENF